MKLPYASRWAWLALLILIIIFVVLVMLAPPEKLLGEAIRYVYVHVALTRAGMWGFYLAGLLGLVVTATAKAGLQRWATAQDTSSGPARLPEAHDWEMAAARCRVKTCFGPTNACHPRGPSDCAR